MNQKTKLMVKSKFTTRQITIVGLLASLSMALGFTGIGYIPIPPFKTTIMHVPVIIGSLLEGPVIGAILGLIFGLSSMFEAVKTPNPVSFIFLNPLVSVIPRMLIGITPYYMFKIVKKMKNKSISLAIATTVGSFTNTIGVLGMIYLLYLEPYMKALGVSVEAANKTFLLLAANGFISAAVAIMITVPVVMAISKNKK